jgi:GTP-binding protein
MWRWPGFASVRDGRDGNSVGELPGDYARYLMNGLRETFGFHGVLIRMKVKAGKNPFDKG